MGILAYIYVRKQFNRLKDKYSKYDGLKEHIEAAELQLQLYSGENGNMGWIWAFKTIKHWKKHFKKLAAKK